MPAPIHHTEQDSRQQTQQQHPLDSSESQIGTSMAPPPFQLKAEDGKKTVSGDAMKRLGYAEEAITYTKGVLKHGAGNQIEALQTSRFNSNFRLKVVRGDKYWSLTPEAQKLANADQNAYKAARAEMAEGGNCGEHANLAYQYLRHKAAGEEIARGSVDGLDHAFTFVGPAGPAKDMANTAVSDPWPTAPKAVLWQDHFAKPFMENKSSLKVHSSMVADGGNPKDLIKAGLTLSPIGLQIINHKLSQKETEGKIEVHENEREEKHNLNEEMQAIANQFQTLDGQVKSGTFSGQEKIDKEDQLKQLAVSFHQKRQRVEEIHIWMWGQEDSHEEGHDFDYQENEPSWIGQAWEWMKSWF